MKTQSIAFGLVMTLFIWPVALSAQESNPAQGQTGQRKVGAPQVLEIPIPQAEPAETDPYVDPYQDETQSGYDQGYAQDQYEPYDPYETNPEYSEIPPDFPSTATGQRTYLGVLYATSEQGPQGVKVLSIVPDSPADRAGFIGVNTPKEEESDLLKAAIVVLAMSPAGPFAIPLAIAHDMYTNRNAPGDLIVSVDNKPVADAQAFTEILRPYKPGDTVAFSIIREGKPMQISVTLEEEPL